MDIHNQLLCEHSKRNALLIADYIGQNEAKFKELVNLFLSQDYRVTQRAGHAVAHVFDRYPQLINPYLEQMILNLKNDVNDAVKRNTLRILQDKVIPEAQEGLLANKCFDYLLSNKEPIAIKAFAMTILANLTMKYPDFKNELKTIVDGLMENGSPGIISRGKKVLKAISTIK